MRGSNERLAAASALLEMQPDHGRARLLLKRLRHLGEAGRLDSGNHGRIAAEAQEIAPVVTLGLHGFPNGRNGLAHTSSPFRCLPECQVDQPLYLPRACSRKLGRWLPRASTRLARKTM